jgi:Nup85 Nucleoporin
MVRVPIESQEQIEELIDLAFEVDLPYQRAEICQTWARRLEETKQIGLALLYFEKGQSFTDIRRICWSLFERLLLNGTPYRWGLSNVKGEIRNV